MGSSGNGKSPPNNASAAAGGRKKGAEKVAEKPASSSPLTKLAKKGAATAASAKKGAVTAASAMSGAASTVSGILSRRSGGSRQPRASGKAVRRGASEYAVDDEDEQLSGDEFDDRLLLVEDGDVAKRKSKSKGASSALAQSKANRVAKANQALARAQNRTGAGTGSNDTLYSKSKPSAYQMQQAEAYRALMASSGAGSALDADKGRPAWNSTPMRHAPAALKGLKPVTPEPWASDEAIYDRLYNSQARNAESGFGVNERHLNKTARKKEHEYRYTDYMARFNQKYAESSGALNKYDGNPFT